MSKVLTPAEVEDYAAHIIRRNMAGRLDNPKIFPKIVELLKNLTDDNEDESFAEFTRICKDEAHMELQGEIIDDLDKFIKRLWTATKAAKAMQSVQPCW